MKANQATPPPTKEELKPCIICGKEVTAFYGTWGITSTTQGGTCSRKCEDKQEERTRFTFWG